PRRDRANDTERLAVNLDAALIVVLNDFDRQVELCRGVGPADAAASFKARAKPVKWLALFLRDQTGEFFRMFLDLGSNRVAGRLSLVIRGTAPALERLASGGDRAVKVIIGRHRHLADDLAGCRVAHVLV